jgi:hypothetical protein
MYYPRWPVARVNRKFPCVRDVLRCVPAWVDGEARPARSISFGTREPNVRSDKMWCAESDFDTRIRNRNRTAWLPWKLWCSLVLGPRNFL